MGRSLSFVIFGAAAMTLVSASSAVVNIVTVPIGNAGNTADASGFGGVAYAFQMGKFEVTAGQYTEFLNAVAATDTNTLWQANFFSDAKGCKINRSGVSGSFAYSVDPAGANRPVNFISFFRAVRFANWMHNGQPAGAQTAATTEDGSYFINGNSTTRNTNATWVLPSEDEWYKAAYHKNNGVGADYFLYPTSSNTAPANLLLAIDPGNSANYGKGTGATGIDPPWFTTLGGEFENSVSPYGTFDQAGNVREWTETASGVNRVARGGDWMRNVSILSSATRETSGTGVGTAANTIGFRLALVPAPSSGVLLAFGGLIATRRRR